MLPNFFVAGAQKAGTTSLYNYLRGHPDVYLPKKKETKFFVDDECYVKGMAYYESEYFSAWKGEKAVGDVDPEYMYFDKAIKRMAKHLDLKTTKFVFILRNPVDRAFSHYLMTLRRGLEPLTFEDALASETERIARDNRSKFYHSYRERGFYYRQVKRFLEHVDISQMFFLLTEDLMRSSKASLSAVFQFLHVSPDYVPPDLNTTYHRAKVPRSAALLRRIRAQGFEKKIIRRLIPLEGLRQKIRCRIIRLNETCKYDMTPDDAVRRMLSDVYRNENRLLSKLIGRDLEHWDYAAQIK